MRSEVDQFVSAVAVDQDRDASAASRSATASITRDPCAPLARAAKPSREWCGQQDSVAIRSGADAPDDVARPPLDDPRSEPSPHRRLLQPLRSAPATRSAGSPELRCPGERFGAARPPDGDRVATTATGAPRFRASETILVHSGNAPNGTALTSATNGVLTRAPPCPRRTAAARRPPRRLRLRSTLRRSGRTTKAGAQSWRRAPGRDPRTSPASARPRGCPSDDARRCRRTPRPSRTAGTEVSEAARTAASRRRDHAGRDSFASLMAMRSGVSGRWVRRQPVASSMALAMAAGAGTIGGSPTPRAP